MMFEMRRFSRVSCLGLVMLVGVLMFETVGLAGQKVAEGKPPAYAANKPDLAEVFKHPQSVMNASKLNLKVGDKTVRNVTIAGTMYRSKIAKVRGAHDAAIGVSIWLPGNPDIFTVSWDCYKFDFAMEYAALTDTSNAVMAQISGYKPIKVDMRYTTEPDDNLLFWGHPKVSYEKAIETKDDGEIVKPKFPSDWLDGYPLAPELLKLRQVSRNAVLSGKVETKTLPSGRVMMPIRLLGKIVSAVDGKPIHMASAWLRRNPYIMARTNEKGAFEILMRNAILRSTSDEPDKLMINAPNYQAIEVDIKKYIDDKVTIKMKPLKLEFREDTIVKMVKVPARFFRMGRGNSGWHTTKPGNNNETSMMSDWPIKTVYLPSYWISIYELTMNRSNSRKGDVHANVAAKMDAVELWAKTRGYTFYDTRNGGSWFWAVKMCNAMSEMEGRTPCYYTRDLKVYRTGIVEDPICDWKVDGYRMPTEAEWDCAAWAGATTRYHWGSKLADQYSYRFCGTEGRAKGKKGKVHTYKNYLAGAKKPNTFGMHDVDGGSYEWTWDWDGPWRPDETDHPKGPSLEKTQVAYQQIFRKVGYPTYNPCKRVRGNDQWALGATYGFGGWPSYLESTMGGVYIYSNRRSWFELGHNHSQPPSGGFGGIIRATISADLSTREHSPLKPAFDLKATLTPPVAIEKIGKEIEMVAIKGGEFRMGGGLDHNFSSSNPHGKPGNSIPARVVTVSSFSIAKFETTSAQWQAVAKWSAKKGYAFENADVTSDNGATPVVGVTWYDALKWCNAASEKAGFEPCYFTDAAKKAVYKKGICEKPIVDWDANGYRLPTEAQWEFAARGGRTEAYYWGMYCDISLGWILGNQNSHGLKVALHPVGRLPGNQFGLYDIVGNAGEWCWDIMSAYVLLAEDTNDPKGIESDEAIKVKTAAIKKAKVSVPVGSWNRKTIQQGGHRVYRSGSHLDVSDYWKTYFGVDTRFGFKPAEKNEDIGFRVVRGGK